MTKKFQDKNYIVDSQYAGPKNLLARRELYQFLVPAFDIREAAFQRLPLRGTEDVLDVGCGDGVALLHLREKTHHKGRLVGLDISRGMFAPAEKLQDKRSIRPKIEFLEASADVIPFPDESFDVLLSFFMLYHMPDIQKTLREWHRVLKRDGKLAVATNSVETRPRHTEFKALAGRLLGRAAPSPFSQSFNLENGEEQLSPMFRVDDCFCYDGELRLTDAEPYIKTLQSIRDAFEPYPHDDEWASAVSAIRKKIEEEIAKNGCFADRVKRGFFLCSKV